MGVNRSAVNLSISNHGSLLFVVNVFLYVCVESGVLDGEISSGFKFQFGFCLYTFIAFSLTWAQAIGNFVISWCLKNFLNKIEKIKLESNSPLGKGDSDLRRV